MWNYDYEISKIKEKMERELDENNQLLAAWENVTFPTKKDGTPFKTMSKNFDGAAYGYNCFSNLELTVSTKYPCYINDSIDCYRYTTYLKDFKKATEKPENMVNNSLYVYDLDDIKEAINERIGYRKECKEELEKGLKNLNEIYVKVADICNSAREKLIEEAGKNTSLYYDVMDSIINNIKYA